MFGEEVVHAAISPHLCSAVPLWKLHSNFRGFSDGVCHVMRITALKVIQTQNTLTQHFASAATFWFETRRIKMPVKTVS